MDIRLELLKRQLQGKLSPEEEKQLEELQKKFNKEVASNENLWYDWLKGKNETNK
jgi:uncharacterized FlgJ-related protein